ncbi:MAG: ABC transporter ATP-binding protein [Gemmatimonadales bacterium]
MVVPGPTEVREAGRIPGAIRASGLTYRYAGALPALNGIDLEIAIGEVVAVVGPPGSGKSTLLRVLAGLVPPTSGTVELPWRRTSGGRLMVGFAGEVEPHFESMTGRQNAFFFARAAGMRRAEAAASVEEHVTHLGLGEDADRPVSEYSFASRRRLLLVEALAHRPALTVLDQPFLGLDQETRGALIHTLRLQSAKRGTVVVASHELSLIPELADRILFIHEGRIVTGGRVAELLGTLGQSTRIEIAFERRPQRIDAQFRAGTRVVSDGDPLVLETSRGATAVGEACAALIAVGAVIKSVTVRESDLAEVFRRLTGAELGS